MTKRIASDNLAERDRPVEIEITEDIVRLGVRVLRDWIPPDGDRYIGHDPIAIYDAFVRMLAASGVRCKPLPEYQHLV